MKLTADQREQLIEAMKHDFIDTMTGNVHRDRVATLIESWLSSPPEGWEGREEWECLTGEARSTLHDDQVHAILDTARFGNRITVTRSNGGALTATVTGPVLAAPDVSKAVGIDLLDGEPHVIRREDGAVFGQIVDLRVEVRS